MTRMLCALTLFLFTCPAFAAGDFGPMFSSRAPEALGNSPSAALALPLEAEEEALMNIMAETLQAIETAAGAEEADTGANMDPAINAEDTILDTTAE